MGSLYGAYAPLKMSAYSQGFKKWEMAHKSPYFWILLSKENRKS